MNVLDNLTVKQLTDRHRQLADNAESLKIKMQPLIDEMEKIKEEFDLVDTELAKRNGLPPITYD